MRVRTAVAILFAFTIAACGSREQRREDPLVGAWRGGVQFESGAFASMKDLEFMYVFNFGGTMTESSNYDGAPPVPPAYGIWRKVEARKYEAKYLFYWTKPPADLTELTSGNGWAPGGYGVFMQAITLSSDGNTFESTMRYQVYDGAGKPTDSEVVAAAKAERIRIP